MYFVYLCLSGVWRTSERAGGGRARSRARRVRGGCYGGSRWGTVGEGVTESMAVEKNTWLLMVVTCTIHGLDSNLISHTLGPQVGQV